MSGNITQKTMYQYVVMEIDKRLKYSNTKSYDNQTDRTLVSTGDNASTSELISAIQEFLDDSMSSEILRGLEVTATDPISDSVNIAYGMGRVGGKIYTLSDNTTIKVPFDDTTQIFYLTLYDNRIMIDKTYFDDKLTIARIVVPNPGVTSLVQDTKDSSWNAYIENLREYKLHGYNGKLEEDSIELLRNNIGDILADNLIGNIRLSENLKVTNTQGTLELNSDSMLLKDLDENLLAKFTKNGVYFYDTDGRELAKFTSTEARLGNIIILPHSMQSGNYVPNISGFVIYDNGDAEFNSIRLRATLYTTTIEENVYIQPGVTFIGDMNFVDDISLLAGKKLIFDKDMGADTYWVYNPSTQYLEGWVDGVKRIEL